MAELVFTEGDLKGKRLPLPQGKPIVFGRQKGCSVVLEDAELSRRHCQFLFDGTKVIVQDLGSLNKTYVNDAAVETQVLAPGDSVRFGAQLAQLAAGEKAANAPQDRTGLETHDGLSKRVVNDPEDPLYWIGKTVGGYELKKYLRTIIAGLFEYEGLKRIMKRQAVLSVLLRQVAANSKIGDRFMRLAASAGSLQHPNITMIFDVGEAEESFYMASEMVKGRSVQKLIDERGGRLDPVVALDMAIQTADALFYLGKRDMVHRDIQPNNLIINEDCILKISNLWVTKSVKGPELTGENRVLGTLDYMAPEQTQDSGGVDHRADIYALGATLFCMLTGSAPFADTTSFVQKVKRIREEPIGDLPVLKKAKLAKPLVAILLKSMEKSPMSRYQTALDMKNALVHAKAELIRG